MNRFIAALLCAVALAALASDKKPEMLSELSFLVLREDGEKPVRNAEVVLHRVDKSGQQTRSGFELKTDPDGKASSPGVPYGVLRVQVIAPGFQTFGQDVTINQEKQEITIKLKRPEKQYSIYEK